MFRQPFARSHRGLTGAWVGILCLTASLGWALQPKLRPTPPETRAFEKAELRVETAVVPLAQVIGQMPNVVAWDDFFRRYGTDFHVFIDPATRRPASIIGPIPLLPGTGVGNRVTMADLARRVGAAVPQITADVVEKAARGLVAEMADVLSVDVRELGPGRVGNPVDYLWEVNFPRLFQGIPVRDSWLSLAINHGNVVLMGTEKWGDIRVSPVPRVTADQAVQTGLNYMTGEAGSDLIMGPTPADRPPPAYEMWQAPHLEFIPVGGAARGLDYRLAWVFGVRTDPYGPSWEFLVDAHSGELLAMRDVNQYVRKKIVGGVYPVSNDGRAPDGQEQAGYPMPWANTGLASPNNFTNGAGVFDYTSGTVTTTLSGKYVRISDQCGAISESSSSGDVDLGTSGGTDCTVPTGHSAGDTHSARSGFYELNRIAEQARGWLPSNTWLQSQLTANMNLNNTCNAFWNGTTVNFYRSGGGCRNTGEIAAIFDHEWGHGLDDNDTNGTISSPGEAIADLYAALRLHTSCIGRGFFWTLNTGCGQAPDGSGYNCDGNGDCCTNCTGVRDIDYAKHASGTPHTPANFIATRCPTGTQNGPCGKEVHCEGQVPAEAGWDLAARDFQAAPFSFDVHTAFIATARIAYLGSGSITSWYACSGGGTSSNGCGVNNGYMRWLTADDDNGNLNDGTPHMTAIYNAFNRHGIACSTPTPTNSGCAGGPTAAPSLTATAGDWQVALSWTGVTNAAQYWVFKTEGVQGCNFGKTRIATVTSTTYTDTEVLAGRQYCYVVMAVGSNSACYGRASTCVCATPTAGTCTLPGTPSLVSPANGATGVSTTPTLDWSDVTGATTYDVQVCTDSACANVVRSATGLTASQWTVSPALNSGTTYYWRARAVNSCGAGPWTATWSFTTAAGGTPTNRLLNPGFESGRVNWVEFSSGGFAVITNSTSNPAHTGSWYAWMGGYNSATEYIYQDVTIPANATTAYVQFWYRITTRETTTSICYDRMVVEVRRPSDNALLATLKTLCNYHRTSAYVQSAQFSVLNFKGQTIRLRFYTRTDSSLPSSFFVDDVVLMADGN